MHQSSKEKKIEKEQTNPIWVSELTKEARLQTKYLHLILEELQKTNRKLDAILKSIDALSRKVEDVF